MHRILSIALLSLLYANSANADLYSASNALSRGDYETAVAEFTKLAEKGDHKAQANLGYMYYAGEGVPQDYKQAVFWYRKAAVQGNRDAQYNLAVSYAFGEGVTQDLTEASIWYRRAGEQGHVVSQYSLGISYAYGEGVPQDQTEAARWFTKAANQGYARAQVQLGSMYHTGEGVDQNYSEAVRWYRMAADRGDATAQYNLATMYRSGKGVEQNYAQAKRWFRQSADQGYAAAQNELASLERSAGANVATRTIQAKPEIYPTEPIEPIVKEELPETTTPEPVAEIEPVQEEKLASNETTAPSPEAIQVSEPSSTDEPVKKPLFSVDKKDLLTLDSSQLDIPEPVAEPEAVNIPVPDVIEEDVAEVETPVEEKIAEIIPAEDVSVDESEPDKPVVSAMHSAMGLPQPEPAQTKEEGEPSENLFTAIGNLFSSDDDSKAEEIEANSETVEASAAIAESEPTTEISEPEPVVEEYVSEEDPTLLTEPVEVEAVTETDATEDEYVAEEDPTLLTEPVDVEELTETDASEDEYVAAEDPTLLTEPVDVEEVTEIDASEDEYVAAEDPTLLTEPVDVEAVTEIDASEDEYVAAEDPTLLTEPVDVEELTETDATEDEYVAAEDPTLLTEPVDVEELTETDATEDEYVAAEDPTLATEPTDTEAVEDETESSGGFFSAIGNFFSAKDKEPETAIAEQEDAIEEEEILIAKVDEPAPVIEEIELAQDVEDDLAQYSVAAGRRALSYNDYDEAEKQFRPLAEAGDSEAQAHLGSLYYVGNGVTQNFISAFVWYKKAADQDNVDAQYSIGNMYLLGEGIEQNNEEAAKWYALASEQGHVAAKNNLQNLQKLESISKQEFEDAPTELAIQENVTETEIPVEETAETLIENEVAESITDKTEEFVTDQIEPAKEFDIQEDVVISETEATVDEYVAEEDPTLLTEPTDTEAVEAETESSGGFFSAIGNFFSGKDKESETAVAEQVDPVDEEEVLIAKVDEPVPVIEEIELAQDIEDDLSQFSVDAGRRALSNSDFDEAVKQFRPLAEAGDSEAQSHLGSLYYVGKGVEQNVDSSFDWYKKAADQGNVDAQYSIGNMYLLGEGVEQNNQTAAEWYALASEQGHIAAKNNLQNLQKLETLNRQNQLNQDVAAEQPISEEITAVENISTEATNVKSYAAGESPSTESLQTFSDIESPETELNLATDTDTEVELAENELIADIEESAQITHPDTAQEAESSSEQSAFFKSLFGDPDAAETTTLKEADSINIEDVDIVVEPAEETAAIETVSDASNDIAEVTEEPQAETEESGGLFGFFGKMFSSDKEKETVDETETEAELPQEVAMVEPELDQLTADSDEINIEEQVIEEQIDDTDAAPKTVLERLRPLATQGDLNAQYELGSLHYSGDGVKQDYSQAALWYRRAAQQGNVDAQYSLGNMYLMGEGITQDDSQAAHWYALAADQGHLSAQHNLANLQKSMAPSQLEIETSTVVNEQVASVETDAKEEQVIELEPSPDSTGKTEYEEGLTYAFGDGVPQNDRNAFNLFYSAAEKGYALAQYKVGVAYAYGEGVRQDQKQAADWYRKAAEQGYTIAQRNLATMYLDGNGIQQDKIHALAWYKVVASQGNAMDIRRRDMLEKELSEIELSQSQELSNQISNRLNNNTAL
jgi:uncharacterized protein